MRVCLVSSGLLAVCLGWACGKEGGNSPLVTNGPRGVAATDLEISVAARRGRAHVTFEPSSVAGASLRVAGLVVDAVSDARGSVAFQTEGGRLNVDLNPSAQPERISVDYTFSAQDTFDGLLPGGMTFTWPYYCENLFPCNPDPGDGLRFTLALTDTPAGSTTVFGASTQFDAPSYMIGWASGNYTKLDLGRTRAGTELAVWHTQDNEMAAIIGAQWLPAVFEYYETLLGPYPYGSSAGSVEVDWGPTGLGGMEHHPYWHVHTASMSDPVVHAHEAAHGWFGNGVRIACWEDLVLSEGLASYLAARALSTVLDDGGAEIWADYRSSLERAITAPGALTRVWPDSCGAIDVLTKGFVGQVLYMKGAFLLRALELRVGAAALDSALGRFFGERVGSAARFQDLLDSIEAVTGYDPNACAQAWLRRDSLPPQATCL